MKTTKILALIMTAVGLTACTEDLTTGSAVQGGRISFTVSVNDGGIAVTRATDLSRLDSVTSNNKQSLYIHTIVEPRLSGTVMTRGTLVNGMDDFSDLNDFRFGVSGARYNTTTKPLTAQNANFFFNAEATYDIGAWWTNTSYYLPAASEQLAFYAYWPYSGNCTDITGVKGDNASETGPMKVSFKVNTTDMANQTDLMTATAIGQSYAPKTPVALPFKHALTAVNFMIGTDMAPGYIKKIELQNICTAGEYTLSSNGTSAGTWNPTDQQTITLDFTNGNTTTGLNTTTASGLLNSSTGPLLMIPQTFTDDTQRIMIYVNDSEDGTDTHGDHYLSKRLSDITSWQEGTVVTYLISTSSINYLRVNSVEYPTLWGTETFALKSDYDTNEMMGVYVVDETGKVICANVPYHKTTGGWTTDNPANVPYTTEYKYFAYYPYTANVTGGHALNDVFLGTDADDFFSGLISNWAINTDQSTAAKLLANDLQICRATTSGVFSKMDFPMQHVMGLVEITLEEKTFTGNINYYLSTDADYQWTGVATETIRASEKLGNNMKAYKNSDTEYYYIVRPNTATTFTCGVSNTANSWNDSYSVTIGSGARGGFTAQVNNSTTLPAEKEWELTVGDVFFNDGSLAKNCNNYPSTDYPNRKAVGLVLSTSTSTTDNNTNGFTHGYVICAQKTYCSQWSTVSGTVVTGDNGYSHYTSDLAIYNFMIGDMDGYTKCHTVMNRSDYTASKYAAVGTANGYNTTSPVTTPHGNCSGWYLPSTGHLYLYTLHFSGIAATSFTYSNTTFHGGSGYRAFRWVGKTTAAITGWNNAFTSRGFTTSGNNIYTQTQAGRPGTLWSSTEASASTVYNLCPWTSGDLYIDGDDGKTTNSQFYVRPVLAF